MRQKKIRGHNRRLKHIDNWQLDNLSLDLNDYLLNVRDRYYAKIRVHPWSAISLTNSETPQPTGKEKEKILSGLLEIYDNWKKQLDKLGQSYYLKIWLFEPRFSKSQVVCAIGDSIDFYENTFFKPEKTKKMNSDNYGPLKKRIEAFSWSHHLDEDEYFNTTLGESEMYASKQDYEQTKKWFERLLKKPHRTYKFEQSIDDTTEAYLFKQGDIWVGTRK